MLVQIVQHAAGSNANPALARIEFQDFVEILGTIQDHTCADALAGLRSAAAARDQRHAEAVADCQRGADVVHALGQHNPKRHDLVDAGIGRIEGTIQTIEAHFAVDRAGQGGTQVGQITFGDFAHNGYVAHPRDSEYLIPRLGNAVGNLKPRDEVLRIPRITAIGDIAQSSSKTTASKNHDHQERLAMESALSPDLARKMDAYWRAANYLSVGQIYLFDNPLLHEPLELKHIKPRLLGHWGTTPGQNFIYVHLNRVIKDQDLNMFYISGPGHGGPGLVANAYLEGTYSEVYPNISQNEDGLKRLFTQFSFPGGIPSHVAPETPGSIHEGGELGYSLSHAYGAVFDNPDLIVACVIGDGEAETGPLATSWHSNKFLDPVRDGAVLPDFAPQRLQDRQPDRARADQPRGIDRPHEGLWLRPLFRRGT